MYTFFAFPVLINSHGYGEARINCVLDFRWEEITRKQRVMYHVSAHCSGTITVAYMLLYALFFNPTSTPPISVNSVTDHTQYTTDLQNKQPKGTIQSFLIYSLGTNESGSVTESFRLFSSADRLHDCKQQKI